MKTSTILLFILIASSNFLFCQVINDSLGEKYIYPPYQYYDSFSAEESWEIHKAAYLKQLKTKGLTDDEIKKSIITYEKQKEEFIARTKEQLRLAAIQRKKAEEQRALAAIERKKADEQRRLAAIQREKADELRKLSAIEIKKADEQRAKGAVQREKDAEQRANDAIQREKANELRKQADIERAKADEQLKLAEIQRAKAEEQRKKSQEWRNSAENILIKNITLSKSNSIKPITFKITSKTTLRFGIRAHINSGTTLIEIYNPNGVKEGELSLEYKTEPNSIKEDDVSKYTSGALDKTISYSEIGDWQIKITSQKSEGTVAISVAQYIKPTMDE